MELKPSELQAEITLINSKRDAEEDYARKEGK